MATLVLTLFCVCIAVCVATGIPIACGLAAGLVLFCSYGLHKGKSLRTLAQLAAQSLWSARNVLLTFLFIGMITASWRASGTIAFIVCHAVRYITPAVFLPGAFVLNSAVSFLLGTAFGTVASVGSVCMAMAAAIGIPPAVAAGAIISGIYFGDRCSPVSSITNLVADVTGTRVYTLLLPMLRTQLPPFVVAVGIYSLVGAGLDTSGAVGGGAAAVLERGFVLSPAAAVPAVVLLVLGCLRVPVRITMGASIGSALAVWFAVQQGSAAALAGLLWGGYRTGDLELDAMIAGGGIVSMVGSAAIVSLSAPYAGLFRGTGLLRGLRRGVWRLSRRTSPFCATAAAAAGIAVISCTQVLTIMLTNQLCPHRRRHAKPFAVMLADSAVLFPGLIPWSSGCAVPLATLGAPTAAVAWACYLYLIPLYRLIFKRKYS